MASASQAKPNAAPRSGFAMLPRLVGAMALDVYAFRLYAHLKFVVGETGGVCWQSTSTLAKLCRMSRGKVSQAKRELVAHDLVTIGRRPVRGHFVDEIRVRDIWDLNREYVSRGADRDAPPPVLATDALPVAQTVESPGSVHQVDAMPECVHHVNAPRSPGGPKKIPCKKSPVGQEEKQKKENNDELTQVGVGEKAISDAGRRSADGRAVAETVAALYEAEIGRAVTGLLREQIGELAERCPDLEVWRHAFVRSLPVENRWSYIVVCVQNEIRRLAVEARATALRRSSPQGVSSRRGESGDGTDSLPAGLSEQGGGDSVPPDSPAALWTQVLEGIKLTVDALLYHQRFAATRCVGIADDGKSWRVEVNSALAVDALSQPRLRKVVARGMRYAGLPEVEVVYVLREGR